MDFRNKKIGILGLGEENVALALYLAKKGAKITICDQRSREELGNYLARLKYVKYNVRFGEEYLDNLLNYDFVFRTPGLPYLNEKIQMAKRDGVVVSSQTNLFFELSPSPIIGVTGTKGKGTTATLISEILKYKSKFKNIYLAGNIGNSPIEFVDKLTSRDIVVLELSSFQLQDLKKSPHIAVILDIKIDHLDYHQDEKEYIDAKSNIVRFQEKKDYVVINADYLTSFEMGLKSDGQTFWFSRKKSVDEGAFVRNDEIVLKIHNKDYLICKKDEVMLRGEHNLENICAAITASYLTGADLDSIKRVVKSFRGLEHRLEFVEEIDSVKYYNDSFSTTPDATIAAMKSFVEPIILIAGGSEKGADYSELGKEIAKSNIKTAILIGKTGSKIKSQIKNKKAKMNIVGSCSNLKEVMEVIKKEAKAGDVILLSPASASSDWFKNYKERGNIFKELVRKLK